MNEEECRRRRLSDILTVVCSFGCVLFIALVYLAAFIGLVAIATFLIPGW